MYIVLLISMALLALLVLAQTPDQQRLKSYDMLVQQRNQAMDGVAYCVGEMQSQVAELKSQLEEAKKACEKPKE